MCVLGGAGSYTSHIILKQKKTKDKHTKRKTITPDNFKVHTGKYSISNVTTRELPKKQQTVISVKHPFFCMIFQINMKESKINLTKDLLVASV